jgi:uncharacterized protein YndB with AHSA1/START domain
METTESKEIVTAHCEMLIRRPVEEVFEAFVDPKITTRFWFTKSTGRLEAGKQVKWEWEMYNVSVRVNVKSIEPNERIVIDWWSAEDEPTTVTWIFVPRSDNTTFLTIANSGFTGDQNEIITQAIASTEGFAFVLANLKALLEHNLKLNLVSDRFPEGMT